LVLDMQHIGAQPIKRGYGILPALPVPLLYGAFYVDAASVGGGGIAGCQDGDCCVYGGEGIGKAAGVVAYAAGLGGVFSREQYNVHKTVRQGITVPIIHQLLPGLVSRGGWQ
jgi:hypothetical protein